MESDPWEPGDAHACMTPSSDPCSTPTALDERLNQVMNEYTHKIAALTSLTEELPNRLCLRVIGGPCSPKSTSPRMLPVELMDPGLGRPRPIKGMAIPPLKEHSCAVDDAEVADETGRHVTLHLSQNAEAHGMMVRVEDEKSSVDSKSTFNSKCSDTAPFTAKAEWKFDHGASHEHIKAACGFDARSKTFRSNSRGGDSEWMSNEPSFISRMLVAESDSHMRIVWESCGVLLAMYDMITIPLFMAYSPPRDPVSEAIEWISRIFWTLNVPVAMTTGFKVGGKHVVDLKHTSMKYLRTWFVVDLATLPADWFFTLSDFGDDENGAGAYVRLLRASRVLRVVRLLRLVKLRNAWNAVWDKIDSEQIGIFVEVVQMVLMLLLVNHYNACLWFLVGKAQSGKSWIDQHDFSTTSVDWGHQYVVAYHWSITQFTPSSMHVQPQSVGERVFAIFVVIFGLVGFSYLVGSITSSLGRLRAMTEKKKSSFWHLRKFLSRNHVPQDLSGRLLAYVEEKWTHERKHQKLNGIELFPLLSESLKGELACAIHAPVLIIHPLFDHLSTESSVTIQRLAYTGVSQFSLASQDVMFLAGEEARHMSILTTGSMQYQRVQHMKAHPQTVSAGEDWVAEPVLWVDKWRHLGDLRAISSTQLLMVDPDLLAQIINLNPLAFWMCRSYVYSYLQWLNSSGHHNLSDITYGAKSRKFLLGFVKEFEDEDDYGESSLPVGPLSRGNIASVVTFVQKQLGQIRTQRSSFSLTDSSQNSRRSLGSQGSQEVGSAPAGLGSVTT